MPTMPSSPAVGGVVSLYGYEEEPQKAALTYLMRASHILSPDETLSTYFPERSTREALQEDIVRFVEVTQRDWTVRRGTQERWEVGPQTWLLEQSPETLRSALQTLGMAEEVRPQTSEFDAVCVLGANFFSMKTRMAYAQNLLASGMITAKSIILLTGARPVTVGVDGSTEDLLKIARKYGISDLKDLMETQLLEDIYSISDIDKTLPVYVINTPAGDLPRPTTETTVEQLLTWRLEHPEIQRILFISNQPYVGYQGAVIRDVVGTRALEVEIAGPGVSEGAKNETLVGSLGSEIWAKTPHILAGLQPISDPKLQGRVAALYERNPFIYKKIRALFNAA